MARLGVPVGWAGENVARSRRSTAPIPKEITNELGMINLEGAVVAWEKVARS